MTQEEWDRADRCYDISASGETRREAVVGINDVIRVAVEAEKERCCAAICNLCGSEEFPLAPDAPGWHRGKKGNLNFGTYPCDAAKLRGPKP